MGLFDFFKPKSSSFPVFPKEGDPGPCDIGKTQEIVSLLAVPAQERNEDWRAQFLQTVQTASFACGDPQVIRGPDDFPYFVMRTPPANTPFSSYCIRNCTQEFLLSEGLGVAINPGKTSADWVFSYGDIVNYHLNGEFFTTADLPPLPETETFGKNEEVLLAQPSESYLPAATRAVIRSFLQGIGIEQPALLMICRVIQGKMVQELAFNLFPEDLPGLDHLNYYMKQLTWYLPRHYIVVSLPKNSSFVEHFAPL